MFCLHLIQGSCKVLKNHFPEVNDLGKVKALSDNTKKPTNTCISTYSSTKCSPTQNYIMHRKNCRFRSNSFGKHLRFNIDQSGTHKSN